MEFIKTATTDAGVSSLAARLSSELRADRRVLWLVTGGSNIPLSVRVMQQIPTELTRSLTITLTDERYGPVGHKDSNWQQLVAADFDFKQSEPLPVLVAAQSLVETGQAWEAALTAAFTADSIIGQFGMGPDGHISGILPASPAVSAKGLVATYDTPTFQRITTTFEAIAKCDVAYLLSFGTERKPMLEKLQLDVPLNEEPAQILKQLPEAYIYNDQVGGASL